MIIGIAILFILAPSPGPRKAPRIGGTDYGRTLQMNAGWIVNGLAGLVTGLLIHKL